MSSFLADQTEGIKTQQITSNLKPQALNILEPNPPSIGALFFLMKHILALLW